MTAYLKENGGQQLLSLPLITKIAVILYILNIFRPHPNILDGWSRVFWFDSVVMSGIILAISISSLSSRFSWRKTQILFIFSALSILIASSLNIKGPSELSHLARVIYITIFSLFILAPWANAEARFHEKIAKLVTLTIAPMSILFILQIFRVGGISEMIYEIYGDTKLRSIASSSPRVYGSFFNANWAGVYLMVCWISLISLSAYKLITIRSFLLLASLLILMTIGTGSRTAIVGISVALLWFLMIWMIFYAYSGKLIAFLKLGTALFCLILLVIIFVEDLVIFSRFQELLTAEDLSDVESLSSRIEQWRQAIAHFMESPLLGPGVEGIPHNSYIAWLQAFGIIGFTPLVALLLALLFRWRTIGRRFSVLYSSSVLAGFLVMAMTAEFFFVTQILLLVAPIVFGIFFIPRPQAEPSSLSRPVGQLCFNNLN